MYIIVNGTDLTKSQQFMTLTAHVYFEPSYERKNAKRVRERIDAIIKDLSDVVLQHYDKYDSEVLSDEQYQERYRFRWGNQ